MIPSATSSNNETIPSAEMHATASPYSGGTQTIFTMFPSATFTVIGENKYTQNVEIIKRRITNENIKMKNDRTMSKSVKQKRITHLRLRDNFVLN